ncbi:glycosyltransferase family 4 protein [Terracoccus sp. 273MFTsu3.1]|uniref:glycosyltransferase family 4 protein n=1 Tax=Terracoccus sp. 273MFTsu3.1 TaxID=1172188 RepID=UPI0018CA7FD6|nr:glycosyltransferase family 4 protein [Terracoccus sp. 273MFTsu3.1]
MTTTIALSADKFHRELVRQLQNDGFDVCVVSSPGQGLANMRRDLGVRTRELSMTRDISPVADLRGLVSWLLLCLRERPELVVAATPKASLLSLIAARVTRVPRRLYSAVGLRLEGAHGGRRRLLVAIERVTTAASTEVVANSRSLAKRYEELRLVPVAKLRQTVPGSSHGVDCTHFSPRRADADLAQRLGLDLSVPVVGFVGRLTHDKGIETLVAAAKLLAHLGRGIQLLIVGPQDEPDSSDYLKMLKDSGLQVSSVGSVDDVRPYFSLMSVHVLPTLREGFPNVVLEASAMGIPTVTTDATGSVDSVLPGVTGLLVPARDPQALAHAMSRLISEPQTAASYGCAARAWVTRDFTPEAVVRSLLDKPIAVLAEEEA